MKSNGSCLNLFLTSWSCRVAYNLDSDDLKKLDWITREVIAESNPYSDYGSLPLVGGLLEAGCDVATGWLAMYAMSHNSYVSGWAIIYM